MTKIVGHRGAVGLEVENTIKGFKLAKQLGVDAIEFDILRTRDGAFVVCHDDNLWRLTGKNVRISKLTYAELAEIHLANGETIPLLYDVLSLLSSVPVVLDIKTDKELAGLFEIINRFPNLNFTIVTELHHIVPECKKIRSDIPVFVQHHATPFGLMRSIKKYGADGLNLNYIWLNPLTYMATRKAGMHIQAYTVNSIWAARLIKLFYPGVWICTNHPDALLKAL